MAQDPALGQLVPPDAAAICEWFVRDHSADYALLRRSWYRSASALLEAWILPGIQLHYAVRKQVIQRRVERAISQGAEQVVVIAAGFDTLSYRLHTRFNCVRFFELDHPATQASKRRSLQAHGAMRSNLSLHPVDLTKTALVEALTQAGVDRQRSTIVVTEGLLMYLTKQQVASFVASLSEFFTHSVELVITFMVPDAKGRRRFENGSRLLDAWLSLQGEPFLCAFDRPELLTLLGLYGFGQPEFWDHERLRQEELPAELRDRQLAQGEHLCVVSQRSA